MHELELDRIGDVPDDLVDHVVPLPELDIAMEQGGADEDDGIARDDEDREPERKLVGPIAEAEGDDGGEEEALIGNGIEDHAEAAALIVAAGDVAIEAIAGGGDEEGEDGGDALPILRMTGLDGKFLAAG